MSSFNPCFNGRCKRTRQTCKRICNGRGVSILVLMEDVKEHDIYRAGRTPPITGFNPCFNGRCKRTIKPQGNISSDMVVSILVLMEDVKELARTVQAVLLPSTFQSLF